MMVAIAYPLFVAVTVAAVLVFVAGLILFAEIVASFLRAPAGRRTALGPVRVAILMPAHNEALVIEQTLSRLQPQLQPDDRLIVVADNCTDQTGRIAEKAGAEVIYRDEPSLRGKGYALDFGVRHLADAPPEAVIILDADCHAEPGALSRIAALSVAEQRPVQARYDLEPPPGATSDYLATASLAWSVKNYIRPLGLRNLGLPCQLMGTGMAFPWAIISEAELGTANIVEDIALGLELAEAGKAPLFMPEARVVSRFPESTEGQHTQRARWERGHLSMIARKAPPLLFRALRSRNLNLFVLAADIAVPPLTFLLFATLTTAAVSAAVALLVGWLTPLLLSLLAAVFLASAIALAAFRLGQSNYFLNILRRMPAYAVSKLTLYAAAFSGKPIGWIRSRRD